MLKVSSSLFLFLLYSHRVVSIPLKHGKINDPIQTVPWEDDHYWLLLPPRFTTMEYFQFFKDKKKNNSMQIIASSSSIYFHRTVSFPSRYPPSLSLHTSNGVMGQVNPLTSQLHKHCFPIFFLYADTLLSIFLKYGKVQLHEKKSFMRRWSILNDSSSSLYSHRVLLILLWYGKEQSHANSITSLLSHQQ